MKGRIEAISDVPSPPWQIRMDRFAVIGVRFDTDAARNWLPPQFELADGATGGFYLYSVDEGWGLNNYTAGIGYLEVEGYDAPDGSKGKYAFRTYMSGLGYQGFDKFFKAAAGSGLMEGPTQISVSGRLIEIESGPAGAAHFRCALRTRATEEETPLGSGVNYWVWLEAGEVRGMACAFTSRFLDAEPLCVENLTPVDDVVSRFQPKELLWAGYMPIAMCNVSAPYILGSSLPLARTGRESAYLALLGELGLGAVLVRADRRPLFVNVEAQRLVGDGLVIEDGLIWPADPELRPAVSAAIDHALTREAERTNAVALPRPSGRKPLILQVVRLNAIQLGMKTEAAALLLITDPARAQKTDPVRFLRLLGLTESEARLASLVGSGLSPREAGQVAGNTEGTVRSVLRQIYDKLDIGRQSELAKLVARLEAIDT